MLLALTVQCFAIAADSGVGSTYYVASDGCDSNPGTPDAPFASLQTARKHVRRAIAEGLDFDITVLIKAGTYRLREPLVFKSVDSGTAEHSVTYAAYENDIVTISGGAPISDWRAISPQLWAAPIDPDITFEQLYVNGERATRARTPNADAALPRWRLAQAAYEMPEGKGRPSSLSITLAEGSLADCSNLQDTHIVIYKDWATFRKQVQAIEPARRRIHLEGPFIRPPTRPGKHNSLYTPERQKTYTCYLEGSPDMMDRPGEWAVNRAQSRLEYRPYSDERIRDIVAVRPVANRLLVIAGTQDEPVQNLHFKGLIFAHCAYTLPDRGHDGRQAAGFYSGGWDIPAHERILPAAVEWRFAHNCSLRDCRLRHVGANGIALLDGCRNNRIEGNRIHDIGANCLMLGSDSDPGLTSTGLVRTNYIENNWLHSGGRDYPSGVGIWIGFARSCAVSHNRLHDLPYSGISLGWQWNDAPSSSANNRVEYNYIFDVMKELGDGGAIYTLGYQPLTILRGNCIRDVRRSHLNAASPNNGFFFDEGSKGYLVDKNTVYDTAFSPLRGHRAKGVLIRDNVLMYGRGMSVAYYSPPYDDPIILRSNGRILYDGIAAMTLQDNEIYSAHSWRRVASRKIRKARSTAGLERPFRKLLME